jgi:hypothetical protein
VIGFLVLFFSNPCRANAGDKTVELKVKAAYLYNFLKFVKWPESKLAADQSEINVCLLGRNNFTPFLEPMTQMTAQGRNINIVNIDDLSESQECQLLFINEQETQNLSQILSQIQDAHFLTVGESKSFAAMGGMIGFVHKEGKIKLEINITAAKRANVQISAKLLEVATIVD